MTLTLTRAHLILLNVRMSKHPKIRLSRLRDIGWRLWDPIGLGGLDGAWANSGAADEYDSYLLKAAGIVRRSESDETAADYLAWAESENMGMGTRADTRSRAEATVSAIRADGQLWSEG